MFSVSNINRNALQVNTTQFFLLKPVIIGDNVIERVTSYKILGVFMDSDLKWNSHVEYIFKKACKKL